MFQEKEMHKIIEARKKYEEDIANLLTTSPELKSEYKTLSRIPVNRLYTPADVMESDYMRDFGFPGHYPFTRGAFLNGYRARTWTRRPLVGLGGAEETRQRMLRLLEEGATGVSIVGVSEALLWDSDDEIQIGYLGKNHIGMDSLADFEALFEGVDLDKISVHLNTWHARGVAMYFAMAQKRGYDLHKLRGSCSNGYNRDCIDVIEYCARHVPLWNATYIDVRNIRDAGCTAVQEIAFAIARGVDVVRDVIARGVDVDTFAPRISFFVSAHSDFLEEIAKFRAMRRMWAKVMREKFGARDPRSWILKAHCQTAGVALTAQQPLNNLARGAIHGLAAVLGGVQSLHICSFDEALATPTEASAILSQRTQQILTYETGVTDIIDPLGGSYYIEALTNKLEEEAQKIVEIIESMGGAQKAENWIANQVWESAYRYQKEIDGKERIIVGVNEFVTEEDVGLFNISLPVTEYDPSVHQKQIERLKRIRRERDNAKVEEAKKKLFEAWRKGENIVPTIIEAVKTYITGGEITRVRYEALSEEVYWHPSPWLRSKC